MSDPRVFTLIRKYDETGVSGTGRVLDGIIFHTGQVIVCWRGDRVQSELDQKTGKRGYSSISIYPSWDAFKHVHIDAHPKNRTEVIFSSDIQLSEAVRESGFLDRTISESE